MDTYRDKPLLASQSGTLEIGIFCRCSPTIYAIKKFMAQFGKIQYA